MQVLLIESYVPECALLINAPCTCTIPELLWPGYRQLPASKKRECIVLKTGEIDTTLYLVDHTR